MIIILPLLLPFTASEKVEIVSEEGKRIVRLIGDVTFQREGLRITCDQATIIGDEIARLYNHVQLEESTTTITAESLYYQINTGVGVFYHSTLKESSLTVQSESLRYDPDLDQIHGYDSVVISDTVNDLLLYGREFVYNLNSGIGRTVGNPTLEILRDTAGPIVAEAETILYYRSGDELRLVDSVRIRDQDLSIRCDLLRYYNRDERGRLFNLEIATTTDRVTGDSGSFWIGDREIESMVITNAKVKREDGDRIDRLNCGKLRLFFSHGSIIKAEAEGNPWGVTTWRNVED
ncbi:hypothetical protein DRP53_06700 [candidate division WOR-3 bacterium]|uniref:Organic solvent tolerance-like N-terminal domain-containing protein n=1 Tax=candidate division WOR-3 bacterium TaxID=2052148 RepID=A0A660SIG7_UNCW3|nr:MAG: hypothetical protein DRP53_06700 [candidate division WOR-3 bacterium]